MQQLKKTLAFLILSVLASGAVYAKTPLKIGMVLPMSGPFSGVGEYILKGAELYLDQHADDLKDYKVEILLRDDTGIAPEISKRVAQELLVKEDVKILAGFGMTPSAFSVAPLATSAKVPMVVMNAATSSITEKSPYIVRTSMTLAQNTQPIAEWALKNGLKNVYTVVADYGPGHDSEGQFIKTFKEGGGNIIESVRVPLNSLDFSAYLRHIQDSKPDAVFVFMPTSDLGVNFIKSFSQMGLDKKGIQLISTGDIATEDFLPAIGDASIGMITAYHYSDAHMSDENNSFKEAFKNKYNLRPNFLAVGGYDGMRLIFEVVNKLNSDLTADNFVEVARNIKFESPRGPVFIDPDTRDIVQDVYIRKVEKEGDILKNIEFDVVKEVKDPVKAAN